MNADNYSVWSINSDFIEVDFLHQYTSFFKHRIGSEKVNYFPKTTTDALCKVGQGISPLQDCSSISKKC